MTQAEQQRAALQNFGKAKATKNKKYNAKSWPNFSNFTNKP